MHQIQTTIRMIRLIKQVMIYQMLKNKLWITHRSINTDTTPTPTLTDILTPCSTSSPTATFTQMLIQQIDQLVNLHQVTLINQLLLFHNPTPSSWDWLWFQFGNCCIEWMLFDWQWVWWRFFEWFDKKCAQWRICWFGDCSTWIGITYDATYKNHKYMNQVVMKIIRMLMYWI